MSELLDLQDEVITTVDVICHHGRLHQNIVYIYLYNLS